MIVSTRATAGALGILGGVFGLLLGGCGDIPRPYAHQDLARLSNPLVVLPSGAGVSLAPVSGLPAPWNRLVALEGAEILRTQGIPAETGTTTPLGHTLVWEAEPLDGTDAPSGTRLFRVTWRLSGGQGDIVVVPVDAQAWRNASPEAAAQLARPVVLAISEALGGGEDDKRTRTVEAGNQPLPLSTPVTPASSTPKAPSPEQKKQEAERAAEAAQVVALQPKITKAPGDGVSTLTKALSSMMRAAGVRVTDNPKKATFGLVGTVTAEPVAGGKDKVTLIWEVTQPISGEVVGTVRQENMVPTGLLDKPWGPLADMIAGAALEGVGDVLASGKVQTPKP